tara:strand:+ start:109 stop:369 length:261 start_codon:yes stop_codon:yes gene_type:complete
MAKGHNNFYFYFCEGNMGEQLRRHQYYQRFSLDHPELEAKLRTTTEKRIRDRKLNTWEALEPIFEDLDKAFNIMIDYGAKEEDLFM